PGDAGAHVQAAVVVEPLQRLVQRPLPAALVDVADVVDVEPVLLDPPLLDLVPRADAELAHHRRRDRGHLAADAGQRRRPDPAQAGHRHAVDVARGGDGAGVEVGVRVQPQHAHAAAGPPAVVGHRRDRSDRQAVVAAQHYRHPAAAQDRGRGFVHRAVPGHDLVEVAIAVHRSAPGILRTVHVAGIGHVHAARRQRLAQAGHAQRLGPHRCAARAGTDVGGDAEDRHRWVALGHAGSFLCKHWSRQSSDAAPRPVRQRSTAERNALRGSRGGPAARRLPLVAPAARPRASATHHKPARTPPATQAPTPSRGGAPASRPALTLLASLFSMWGFITVINNTLLPHLRSVFDLNYTQTTLIESVWFIAYAVMGMPSAFLIERTGYKNAIIIGLAIMAAGALMMVPAARIP